MLSTGRRMRQLCGLATLTAVAALPLSGAAARPGTVYWTAYLRSGPGVKYAVIDEVSPQSRVDVQDCARGWCKVTARHANGYVEAALLSAPDIHAVPHQAEPKATCVDAVLNGLPRGDDVRFCAR